MLKKLIVVVLFVMLAFVVLQRDSDWAAQIKTYLPFFQTGVEIDFTQPLKGLSEAEIDQRYKSLSLACVNEPSDISERICWEYISSFNGLPAKMVRFHFINDGLEFIHINYDGKDHVGLLNYLETHFEFSGRSKDDSLYLMGWKTSEGELLVENQVPKGVDGTLLWNSARG